MGAPLGRQHGPQAHVVVRFAAPQRARTLGFPVWVEMLHLSPTDPTGFLAALRG